METLAPVLPTLVPSAIALVGVLVGLRANRRWNERTERREIYNDFLDAAGGRLIALAQIYNHQTKQKFGGSRVILRNCIWNCCTWL